MRFGWLSTCFGFGHTGKRSMDKRTVVACVLVGLSTAACSHVAPYERGKLAHPMMTAEDLEGPAAAHVLAVHEGATGGGTLSESGCGCN
jgi:hypothetical protein